MFRKRVKKLVSPEIFLPMRQRVVAIIQLCIVFTLICWYSSEPFMGRHFAVKSKMALFERVMKIQDGELFSQLPIEEQQMLLSAHKTLQEQLEIPFLTKLKESLKLLALDIPPFEQAWLLFSLIIPILLLKRVEGAQAAAWLLPIIVLAYAADNQLNSVKSPLSVDEKLFPSEETILKDYLKEALSPSIFKQQEQLLAGWHLYLIKEWGKEEPSTNPSIFEKQIQKGEFAFTLERTKMTPLTIEGHVNQKMSLGLLAIYLSWNLFFAWTFRNPSRQRRNASLTNS